MTTINFTRTALLASAFALLALPAGAQTSHEGPTNEDEFAHYNKEQLSYAIGAKFGADVSNTVKRIEIEADWAAIERGFADRLIADPKMTDDQVREVLEKFQDGLPDRLAKKHRAQGEAFRAQFLTQQNTRTTDSGLIIKTDINGNGPIPTSNDIVNAKYRVTLTDGTEVDNSERHQAKSGEFPVKGLIRGWTEALEMMPVGSHWIVVMPPELAYGENGVAPKIGPDQTLIFDVELLSCRPAPPPVPPDLLRSDIVEVPSQADLAKGAQAKVLKTVDEKADAVSQEKQQTNQLKK